MIFPGALHSTMVGLSLAGIGLQGLMMPLFGHGTRHMRGNDS